MFTQKIQIISEANPTMLTSENADTIVIQSFDNDPFYNLIPKNGSKFKSGWYKFIFKFNLLSGEVILPKIYFNFGHGFSENHHWKLFFEEGEIFGMVKLPWDCVGLRFDLSEKNISFSFISIHLEKNSKLFAFYNTSILANRLGIRANEMLKKIFVEKKITAVKTIFRSISEGTFTKPYYHSLDNFSSEEERSHIPSYNELLIHSRITELKNIKLRSFLHDTNESLKKTPAREIQQVDIILPVYNGLVFLETLIPQIEENSDIPYNLYIIDDCSTDSNVSRYLADISKTFNGSIYIEQNKLNLGFTKTVNQLLKKCTSDYIVLLNSDIELSSEWLSRLLEPFRHDETVGTVTAMSNCATICSFPNIGDNDLLSHEDISSLNKVLKKLPLFYEEIPTGVGFCMALKSEMLRKIGLLDEKNFPRGYGEEVDLCFRARKSGYKNLLNASLFVYHKHGGSFSSHEKKKLVNENQKKVESLHPDFSSTLSTYFNDNLFVSFKLIYLINIIKSHGKKLCIYFEHDLGGGTNTFTKNYQIENPEFTYLTVIFPNPNINSTKTILLSVVFKNITYKCIFDTIEELFDLFESFNITPSLIIVNSLVSYTNLFNSLSTIINYKRKNSEVILNFMGHDFYPICPNFLLFRENTEFCNIPDNEQICTKCISNISKTIETVLISADFTNHNSWRSKWGALFQETDSIVVFSESAKILYTRTWADLENKIIIKPHQLLGYKKPAKRVINCAILGNIHSVAKGSKVVLDLAKFIEEKSVTHINLISLGAINPQYDSAFILKAGSYKIDTLYEKLIECKIDVIFIPSVCSETFSFTTREAIESGLPTACFKLGGQYDQIKNYKKGIVIEKFDPQTITESIENYFSKNE